MVWGPESGAGVGDYRRMRFAVRRPDGSLATAQTVGSGNYWGHNYVEVAFPVSVGPLGYAACSIEEGQAPQPEGGAHCLAGTRGGERQPAGQSRLENEFLEVAFDHASGGVVRLLDKRTGHDLADPARPLGLPEYVLERPRGMSAWITADPRRTVCPLELVSFEPGQTGPYAASMVAKARVNGSEVTVTYTLKSGQPWLEIAVKARWVELGTDEGTPALRMKFPFALTDPAARYEIPFGSIERDLNKGEEVPALRWADVAASRAMTTPAARCSTTASTATRSTARRCGWCWCGRAGTRTRTPRSASTRSAWRWCRTARRRPWRTWCGSGRASTIRCWWWARTCTRATCRRTARRWRM